VQQEALTGKTFVSPHTDKEGRPVVIMTPRCVWGWVCERICTVTTQATTSTGTASKRAAQSKGVAAYGNKCCECEYFVGCCFLGSVRNVCVVRWGLGKNIHTVCVCVCGGGGC